MPASAPKSAERPHCRCGYDRTNHRVHAEPSYGFWSWLLLLNGATGAPKKVVYRCGRCGQVVETVTDPAELREFR